MRMHAWRRASACVHAHPWACTCTCMHACMHACTYAHALANTYEDAHIDTHAHMHACFSATEVRLPCPMPSFTGGGMCRARPAHIDTHAHAILHRRRNVPCSTCAYRYTCTCHPSQEAECAVLDLRIAAAHQISSITLNSEPLEVCMHMHMHVHTPRRIRSPRIRLIHTSHHIHAIRSPRAHLIQNITSHRSRSTRNLSRRHHIITSHHITHFIHITPLHFTSHHTTSLHFI